jgi:hypothetical protein
VWTLRVDGRVERFERISDRIAHRDVTTVTGGRAIAAAGPHVVVATNAGITRIKGGGVDVVFDVSPDAAADQGDVDAVAVDEGGRVAVGLRGGRVLLFDDAGVLQLDVAAHAARAAVVAFCDGGAALCSAGWDGRVRIMELRRDGAARSPRR